MSSTLGYVLVGAGLAAGCVVWAFASLIGSAEREDPPLRERPPLLWRCLWPLVTMLARWPGAVLARPNRRRWQERLHRSGLDGALSPEQFQAGRLLCALAGLGIATAALAPIGRMQWPISAAAMLIGYQLPASWLNDAIAVKIRRVEHDLPFFLDMLTLSLEAGLNVTSALGQAIDNGPPGPLRGELLRVMRDLRAGRTRVDAFRAFGDRLGMPAIRSLVSALLTAERQGASLGLVLRVQAEQRRNERFLRAERLAMEAPVKMLAPLLLFIFPCSFLILFYPIAVRLFQEGMLR
jgi:tight adherence protein C